MVIAELFATLGLLPDKNSFDVGHALIESLHTAVEAYLSVEALKGVIEMFQGVAEAADHAAKASQRTGLAIETFQELDHVAAMNDTSIGSITSGLDKLEKGMEKFAKTGKGPVGDALRKLHVSFSALRHATPEHRLEILADAFAKLPASAEKAALATQLLGGAGKSLIPMFNGGAAGIAETRQEAHNLGLVIEEEVAHKFEEFNDQQSRVSAWFQGFRNQIAVGLLPVLSELIDKFYDWLMANRDWIEEGVDTVLNALITGFQWLSRTLASGIEFLKTHKEYLVALGLVIAGIIVPAVVSWAAATVIAMAPWVALGAAVALVAYWIKEIWDDSNEGYTMADVWEAIKSLAEDFGNWLSQLPDNATRWIDETSEAIKKAMADAWQNVTDGAKAAWQGVKDTVKQAWDDIKDIPIVGHLIRGASYLHSTGNLSEQLKEVEAALRAGPGSPEYQRLASGQMTAGLAAPLFPPPVVTINGGALQVTVHAATMTPEQVRDTVAGHVREVQTDAIRQAYNNLGGGKRQ